MNNETITRYLLAKRTTALATFQATPVIHPLLQRFYTTFTQLDYEQYHKPLKTELRYLVRSWPTTSDAPLDALFFDLPSIYHDAVPTQAYGLNKQASSLYGEDLDLDAYKIAPGLEALQGPTLLFLAPVQEVFTSELSAEWKVIDLWDLPGSSALTEAYLVSGLLVMQRVLRELDHEQAFASLPLKHSAYFLLGSLDWGPMYPLLRLEKQKTSLS